MACVSGGCCIDFSSYLVSYNVLLIWALLPPSSRAAAAEECAHDSAFADAVSRFRFNHTKCLLLIIMGRTKYYISFAIVAFHSARYCMKFPYDISTILKYCFTCMQSVIIWSVLCYFLFSLNAPDEVMLVTLAFIIIFFLFVVVYLQTNWIASFLVKSFYCLMSHAHATAFAVCLKVRRMQWTGDKEIKGVITLNSFTNINKSSQLYGICG